MFYDSAELGNNEPRPKFTVSYKKKRVFEMIPKIGNKTHFKQ